ncbi:MAG: hypothetical protein CMP11_05080 [Zetaproteobacteria bacterium]|nr:hypothetical protein [Pseudobdellovibrionaceae bacterium]
MDKKKNWVVIGGGVTSDITSFAASIAKIDVTIVPTTLLAMVDASVGGKCGVNFFPYGKNLIGSFYPAKQIIICKSWLETLSQREFYSGLTECLKHAFLMSSWEGIKKVSDWGVSCRVNDDKLFYKLVLFKQEVVKNDFFEQDKRVILNLGHTLGHAIETFLHQDHLEQISHGQAVAIGMVFSLVASFREGLMTCKVFDSLIRFIFSSRILQERTKIKKIFNKNIEDKSFWSVIFLLMRSDKKQVFENVNDKVSWVLLENIGQCFQEKDYKYKLDFETSYTYWLETLNILDQCG